MDNRKKSNGKFPKKQMERIKEELADVAIYLLDLCDVLGVDLSNSIRKKMIKNAVKYPVGSKLS